MAESTKTYSEAEYNALADQLAQLKANLYGQGLELLKFQSMVGSNMGYSPQQHTYPGQPTVNPQGFETIPGAGAFGPQGVMFAGGSPWKVDTTGANRVNTLYGITQALQFLKQTGLLDKLTGGTGGGASGQANPATSPIYNPASVGITGG